VDGSESRPYPTRGATAIAWRNPEGFALRASGGGAPQPGSLVGPNYDERRGGGPGEDSRCGASSGGAPQPVSLVGPNYDERSGGWAG